MPQRRVATFFLGFTHSSRDKKAAPRRPPLSSFGRGRASVASGLSIAIEAAWCGLENENGDLPWRPSAPSRRPARTSSPAKSSPSASRPRACASSPTCATGENAPATACSGRPRRDRAAWSKRSNEGRDYLGLKLDDPSFNAPIYANLFDDEDGEGYSLIWSRPNGRRGGEPPGQGPGRKAGAACRPKPIGWAQRRRHGRN